MMRIKKLYLFFVLAIVSFFCLSAAISTQVLTMGDFPADVPQETHRLWSLQNHLVQVRGFWHPISVDKGVLSADIGLKSCCLALPAKIYQQLIVKGQLSSLSPQRVVTVEGIFKIDPLFNQEGQLIQFYVLEEAKVVQEATSYSLVSILGFLCFLFLGVLFFKKLNIVRLIDNSTFFK